MPRGGDMPLRWRERLHIISERVLAEEKASVYFHACLICYISIRIRQRSDAALWWYELYIPPSLPPPALWFTRVYYYAIYYIAALLRLFEVRVPASSAAIRLMLHTDTPEWVYHFRYFICQLPRHAAATYRCLFIIARECRLFLPPFCFAYILICYYCLFDAFIFACDIARHLIYEYT